MKSEPIFENFLNKLKKDSSTWDQFQKSLIKREISPKTILLNEGEVAKQIHFIKKGCLRMWFNKDGKDITFQFFFENHPIASFDSFFNKQPSVFSIESIETTQISSLNKNDFEKYISAFPEIKENLNEFIFQRFRNYMELFLSRIKDTPQERYEDLIKNNPDIIKRVPQHYIASYLGITKVSLSRIRNR